MKKTVKFILPFLVVSLMLTSQIVKGDYEVSLGEIYVYDVNSSEQSITLGINSADSEGYNIAGNDFLPGTSVSLNITEVDPLGVDYNISAAGYSEVVTILVVDESQLLTSLIYPFLLIDYVTLASWNQATIEGYHKEILMIPFISFDNSTWENWMNMADEIHNNTLFSETYEGTMTVDASCINTTDSFVFEFILRGDMDETVTTPGSYSVVNASLLHQFQFAYDKSSGVMQGMRMEGSVTGLANGTVLEISYNYHTELQGYNLPDLSLGGATWPFSGYEFLIAFGALSSITIAVLILVKRKK